jgi:hypothetical protein
MDTYQRFLLEQLTREAEERRRRHPFICAFDCRSTEECDHCNCSTYYPSIIGAHRFSDHPARRPSAGPAGSRERGEKDVLGRT